MSMKKNEILLYMTKTTRANKVMSILHKEIMKLKKNSKVIYKCHFY